MDDSSKEADVEPGGNSNGMVTFTGYVIVDHQLEPEIFVEIEVDAGGWGATVTPSSSPEGYTWENMGEPHPITVTVRAPSGTSHKVSQTVRIGGTWHGRVTWGDIEGCSVIVFIEQYFRVDAEVDGHISVDAGDRLHIPVEIWNLGNDEDDLEVIIENRKGLVGSGWSFGKTQRITIEEKMNATVTITARAPDRDGQWRIDILVTSERCRLKCGKDPAFVIRTVNVEVRKDWTVFYMSLGSLILVGIVLSMILLRSSRNRRGDDRTV